jgi:hypothetical protein
VTEGSRGRARHGRPIRRRAPRRPSRGAYGVALRVGGAIAVGVLAFVISGWSPGLVGVLVGVLTWLSLTARHALARRRPN